MSINPQALMQYIAGPLEKQGIAISFDYDQQGIRIKDTLNNNSLVFRVESLCDVQGSMKTIEQGARSLLRKRAEQMSYTSYQGQLITKYAAFPRQHTATSATAACAQQQYAATTTSANTLTNLTTTLGTPYVTSYSISPDATCSISALTMPEPPKPVHKKLIDQLKASIDKEFHKNINLK